MNEAFALGELVLGAFLAVWATDRLLAGLVGLARFLPVSVFAAGALLSGFEVENVAVGIAAGLDRADEIALGSVFGGAIFLVCAALGAGALIAPLRVRLPRSFVLLLVAAPLAAGIGIAGERTGPAAGVVLLVLFAAAMTHLVHRSRDEGFGLDAEVEEELGHPRSRPVVLALTLLGLVGVALGGKLVADGAESITAGFGLAPLFVGMVVAPAAVELEEIARQAVPARRGHPEVSAANLVGTQLYFCLFTLGVLSLTVPIEIDPRVRSFDWPFLVGASALAAVFLWRGRVGRREGAVLVALYLVYAALRAAAA